MKAKITTDYYNEVIHWRRNTFRLHSGRVGKVFVSEMDKLFQGFAENPRTEYVVLSTATILPHFLLQKPYRGSKAKDHIQFLERRMQSWLGGCGRPTHKVLHNPATAWDT